MTQVLTIPGNLKVESQNKRVVFWRMFVLQLTKGNGGISEPFK